MTIGERIKVRREELGMTQEELAKKLGYKSRSSINKIELNGRNLTQTKIKEIADALQTTPSYIMGWENEEEQISILKRRMNIAFDKLNDLGQHEAVKRVEELSEIPRYKFELLMAAHSRTDTEVSDNSYSQDIKIMMDEDF